MISEETISFSVTFSIPTLNIKALNIEVLNMHFPGSSDEFHAGNCEFLTKHCNSPKDLARKLDQFSGLIGSGGK